LIDFLSHAAIVGFMGGAAITIALQQLKGFLGIKTKNFTTKTDIVNVLRAVFSSAEHGVCSRSLYLSICTSKLLTK
jgi:high affinity sulfate transporter 1